MRRAEEKRQKREAQLERRKHEYLIDDANIEVFGVWWTFREHLTPQEAAEMPSTLRQDFMTILRRLSEDREYREGQDKQPMPFGVQDEAARRAALAALERMKQDGGNNIDGGL